MHNCRISGHGQQNGCHMPRPFASQAVRPRSIIVFDNIGSFRNGLLFLEQWRRHSHVFQKLENRACCSARIYLNETFATWLLTCQFLLYFCQFTFRFCLVKLGFLARDSIHAERTIAIAIPSVCPSVLPSHGWISQKRLKLGSCNFHHTVDPSL